MKKALLICLSLAAAPAQAKIIEHKVEAGETLQKISMKYFGTTRKWQKLFVLNQKVLKTPNSVEPGMTLEIDDALGAPTVATTTPEPAPNKPTPQPAPEPVREPATPKQAAAPVPEEATNSPVVPPKKAVKDSYPAKEGSEAAEVADGEDESDLNPESTVTFRFGSHKFIGPDL